MDENVTWQSLFEVEFNKEYYKKLQKELAYREKMKMIIYPPKADIFNAFHLTPLNKVKVIIVGQDPYHNVGQAHGLSFSVKNTTTIPPSLVNIFKEIKSDIGISNQLGDLSLWAKQGVLLINSCLTVEAHRPASHQGLGWDLFTNNMLTELNKRRNHLVFILWGNHAQKKVSKLIDETKHLILKGPHPSPLSAYRGFLGCEHFSKTNNYLRRHGKEIIDWSTS